MSADQPSAAELQAELSALRSRVAELEQLTKELDVFRQLTEKAPGGVHLVGPDQTIVYANQAWAAMVGRPDGGVGLPIIDLIDPIDRERVAENTAILLNNGIWHGQWSYMRADGSSFPGDVAAILIQREAGTPPIVAGVVRDLTAQQQADQERAVLQEQVIMAQREALREVSTPLIPLADDIVVMPLVGAIDSMRAQQIMEVLLEGIAAYQADTVLLDISGVRVVDTQVADALLRSARAVQLLGAQIILTGVSAEVAQTIVHLGADMGRIMTRANLQEGLSYALERRGR
ncbi:MAG: STAS domain-containing protein [Oscillochloridaceae bacterium umkhey_bin13]